MELYTAFIILIIIIIIIVIIIVIAVVRAADGPGAREFRVHVRCGARGRRWSGSDPQDGHGHEHGHERTDPSHEALRVRPSPKPAY